VRVIVTGSRAWEDEAAIMRRLAALPASCTIVVGYNPDTELPYGVDKIAYHLAHALNLSVETHPADWKSYGKVAGLVRNTEMARAGASLCIAFWDGRSRGTKHMIGQAHAHGIPVETVKPS